MVDYTIHTIVTVEPYYYTIYSITASITVYGHYCIVTAVTVGITVNLVTAWTVTIEFLNLSLHRIEVFGVEF